MLLSLPGKLCRFRGAKLCVTAQGSAAFAALNCALRRGVLPLSRRKVVRGGARFCRFRGAELCVAAQGSAAFAARSCAWRRRVLPPSRRGVVRGGVEFCRLRGAELCVAAWEILGDFERLWEILGVFFAALKPRRNITPYCLQ